MKNGAKGIRIVKKKNDGTHRGKENLRDLCDDGKIILISNFP
jgi:hypothetical protein